MVEDGIRTVYVRQVPRRSVPPNRPPLTRERILRRGVEITDREGLDSLTMRSLAAELGFEVMSLYNHVRTKDDLLDGMLDLVAGEVALPGPEKEWKPALRHTVISARDMLSRHPWVAPQWFTRLPGPHRLELMESWLRVLATSGLDPVTAHQGFHALTNHVVGSALQQPLAPDEVTSSDPAQAHAFLATLPEGAFPHLVEHVHQHIEGDNGEGTFEFVLDRILDGLAARRQRAPTTA